MRELLWWPAGFQPMTAMTSTLNLVQQFILRQHSKPEPGSHGVVRVEDFHAAGFDYELLKQLLDHGVQSGHWTISYNPHGAFGYQLTAAGVSFLQRETKERRRS